MLERLERQEKLTANQWKIIATANVGDMLDFFDFFLIGYVLAFILKDSQITYGQSALILISAGLGAVPGAFFWGWMGDRIGRRKVFIITALNVAFATGIMFFTPHQDGWIAGWIFLSFFRFFVGFGNAGLIAVDIPLVQEFVPTYKRGWVSGLTTVLLPAGNILGALSGMAPRAGYRLARPIPCRSRTSVVGPDDPLLGPGIAALAHAHGADGGGTQIARLGVAM
jgi:MFS transporter, putative metabolite:H+ symporter